MNEAPILSVTTDATTSKKVQMGQYLTAPSEVKFKTMKSVFPCKNLGKVMLTLSKTIECEGSRN